MCLKCLYFNFFNKGGKNIRIRADKAFVSCCLLQSQMKRWISKREKKNQPPNNLWNEFYPNCSLKRFYCCFSNYLSYTEALDVETMKYCNATVEMSVISDIPATKEVQSEEIDCRTPRAFIVYSSFLTCSCRSISDCQWNGRRVRGCRSWGTGGCYRRGWGHPPTPWGQCCHHHHHHHHHY